MSKSANVKRNQPKDRKPRMNQGKREPRGPFMLTPGRNTNFFEWKEVMETEVGQAYGSLDSIIALGELFEPADIDPADYDLDDDESGLEAAKMRAAVTSRQKQMDRQEELQSKLRAFLWKYLSRESREEVLRHEDYDVVEHRNDPLQLFLSIRATHQGGGGGGALDEESRRAQARQNYRSTRQGPFESIAEYKAKFTAHKEAYTHAGNVELPERDVAMDFLYGLDNARYAGFKADIENDRAKGVASPQSLNDMYHRASCFVVVKSNWKPSGGAAFATRADEYQQQEDSRYEADNGGRGGGRGHSGGRGAGGRGNSGRGGDKGTRGSDSGRNTKSVPKKPKKPLTCFRCHEEGHFARECPNESDNEEEQGSAYATGAVFATRAMRLLPSVIYEGAGELDDDEPPALVSDTSSDEDEQCDTPRVFVGRGAEEPRTEFGRAFAVMKSMAWYEVLLDNQADVSIVHPRLMSNVRREKSYVSGMSGTTPLPFVGFLKGFFECKGSLDVPVSVICMADAEDMYRITYVQGVSYTVHMDDRDLVFHRRNKFYVADMRAWECSEQEHMALVTSVEDNESRFTKSEVKKARMARELVVNAGFSSEQEALGLVNDGNITGVPITGKDVKRSFEIYGKTVHGVRGRRTAHKAPMVSMDRDLKSPHGEMQEMYGDVVYIRHKPFMMCVTKPLGLVTVTQLVNTKTMSLGAAVQQHVHTISSRGFHPTVIYLDPQRGFAALDTNIPGVEVVISGAGDHMNRLDVEARHVKEICRSVMSGLLWNQPDTGKIFWQIQDKFVDSRHFKTLNCLDPSTYIHLHSLTHLHALTH
jgi:hypothetical protein